MQVKKQYKNALIMEILHKYWKYQKFATNLRNTEYTIRSSNVHDIADLDVK